MSVVIFEVGDKVVLDGEAWGEVPAKGQVVTITNVTMNGFADALGGNLGTFYVWGEPWFVWSEEGHPFHGTIINESSQPGTEKESS